MRTAVPSLPAAEVACQRCKLSKQACDHASPKCARCEKARAACIIVDPIVPSKRYSRGHITLLQTEERRLQASLLNDSVSSPQLASPHPAAGRRTVGTGPAKSPQSGSEYVGDNGGLSLLRSIFAGGEWTNQRVAMQKDSYSRPQIPELNMTTNEAPAFDEAFALLENYFSRFHIHHSFLLRNEVFATFDKVYSSSTSDVSVPQDHFRLFMIFAISSVTRYRTGLSREHPYGYYLAALQHIDRVSLVGSANAIQNLLLVARFGMYYHVGISLWDVSQSCMRQCVELGYHGPSFGRVTPFEEQTRRRIFWECYILDRYSSAILGRPFAIGDEDISVELPIVASDEAIQTAAVHSLSEVESQTSQVPNELSVFVFCIQLRRISSAIRTDFYRARERKGQSGSATPQHLSAAGRFQVKVDQYVRELDGWRSRAPAFANPASLYERPEWYDYLLEADKLALFRAAMYASPKRRNGRPPSRLLRSNLESAARAIGLYAEMFERRLITWTRNYFQTMFIAGISIIHCLSFSPTDSDFVADSDCFWPAVNACSEVLTVFAREMPDAGMFTTIFAETKKQSMLKCASYLNTSEIPNSAAQETSHDSQNGAESTALRQSFVAASSEVESTNIATSFDPFAFQRDLLFSDDLMQSIEAGLGQYACGIPDEDPFNFDFS